jgi:outer membrane receptor protein involved in Fe transport
VLSLFEGNATVSLSAINFLDEDPPFVSVGPNYDPFTHDPRGRVLKLGLKYAFFQQ